MAAGPARRPRARRHHRDDRHRRLPARGRHRRRTRSADAPLYFALTDGHWKYVWYREGPGEQLYDLREDPQECCNLAVVPEHDERRRRMHDLLVERMRARGSSHVSDGRLWSTPPLGDTTEQRRADSWPGFHTERYHVDVRH